MKKKEEKYPKFKKGKMYRFKTDRNLTVLCTGNSKKYPDKFEGVVISGQKPLLAVGSYYRTLVKSRYKPLRLYSLYKAV